MTDMTVEDAPEAPAIDVSILGDLREKRQKIGAGADPLFLPVAGYEGALVAEYRWVPLEDLRRKASSLKTKGATEATVQAAVDAVLACQKELHTRVNGELVPLATDGKPVTFSDPRLAYALGFDAASGRESVIATFNNNYALIDHASALVEWLRDTSKAANEEFLGE